MILKVGALVLLISVSAGGVAGTPAASPSGVSEDGLKAIFLVKFFDFVEWPADALPASADTIEIGVLGDGPVLEALRSLEGRQVDGRNVVVRRLSSAGDRGSCRILFFSEDLDRDVGRLLAELGEAPVLTVGEAGDFIRRGGMVRFYVEGKRVRFEISPEASKRGGLTISSHLLRLAAISEDDGGR
jgi:hypothetical protein